jgi:hypothetical protein
VTNAEISALIAALSAAGLNIFSAIQQANLFNSKPDLTAEDWATLDAMLDAAIAQSELLHAATAARRAAALAGLA